MKKSFMNTVKKSIAFLTVSIFVIAMLAACGGTDGEKKNPESPSSAPVNSQAPDATPEGSTSPDAASGDETLRNTMTYDEMVTYLQQKGFIAEDAAPVDMNTTAGYLMTEVYNDANQLQGYESFSDQPWEFANIARDYGGLYLIWYDPAILEGYDPNAADQDLKAEALYNIKEGFLDRGQTEIPSWPLVFEKDSSGDVLSFGVIPNLYLNGSTFFIAFSDDYTQKDAVIAEFTSLK